MKLPHRGVRPGPAKFEIAVTILFLVSMVLASFLGGPSDPTRALLISLAFFLFGFLVVRKSLFFAAIVPVLLSLIVDKAGGQVHASSPQVILWLASAFFI